MYGAQGGFGSGMDQTSRGNQFVEGKVFLGGLDNTVTKEGVQEYCMQWGAVKDAVVLSDKGFGFVTFEDPKVAQSFLEQREHQIGGRRVDVKAGVPKAAGGTGLTKKMFVGGTGEITDEEFRAYFEQFGVIEDAAIARKEGVSRGFGFVTYSDEISVEKALVVAHHLPNGKRVELKRAVPKEQMRPGAGAGGGGYSGGRGVGGYGGRGGGGGGGYGAGAAAGGYGGGRGGYGAGASAGGAGGYGAAAGGYGMQSAMQGGYGGYAMPAMAGYGAMGYGAAAMGGYGAMGGMGGYGAYGAAAGGAGVGAMGGYGRSPALGRGGRGQARYRPY